MQSHVPTLIFDFADIFERDSPHRRLAFTAPERVIIAQTLADVLPALHEISLATQQGYYAAGFICYEAAPAFDAALSAHSSGPLPLLWFGLFSSPVDLPEIADGKFAAGDWKSTTPRAVYDQDIAVIRDAIRRGDTYQVNYTIRLSTTFSGDALAWYGQLHGQSHGAFNAFLDIGPQQILSLSPELFFSWDGATLTTKPMKGTARRTSPATSAADDAVAAELIASEKNRAENVMIVDLLRNDLARIAVTGSVKVPYLLSVESYPTLYQLTSTVTAQTHPGITLADIFSALFPCGSITGAPKIKTTEIITSLEKSPRGIYCGAIGYITPQGKATFNVPIRTVVVDQAQGIAECGVGGGIVWDSAAADEYAETMTKALFLTAQQPPQFELLETLLLQDGRYIFYERHIERMERSAIYFEFSFLLQKIEAALQQHAAEYPTGIRRTRLLAAVNGDVRVESAVLDRAPDDWFTPPCDTVAVSVALADEPIDRHHRFLYHKTTERSIYHRHVEKHPQAFDVLLWNQDNELTEFTRGNVVMEIDGKLLTPPLASGLLAGTLRAELLAHGVIEEVVLRRDDLMRASKVWFVNGVRGWITVKMG